MSVKDVIQQTKQPQTRKSLLADFKKLGLEKGMTVIVHSSLRSIGWVSGGPVAVIQALQDVLTPSGTLIMPTHTGSISNPEEWENPSIPETWWETVWGEMPAFDPAVSPTNFMGKVAETFRTIPDVRRSNHPLYSFAAWGKYRDQIIDTQSLDYGLGEESPLAEIYNLGGHVLLLGTGYDSNTSMHLGEHKSGMTKTVAKESMVLEAGNRVCKQFMNLDYDDERFEKIGKSFEGQNKIYKGLVGQATSRFIYQQDLVDFTANFIRKRL